MVLAKIIEFDMHHLEILQLLVLQMILCHYLKMPSKKLALGNKLPYVEFTKTWSQRNVFSHNLSLYYMSETGIIP